MADNWYNRSLLEAAEENGLISRVKEAASVLFRGGRRGSDDDTSLQRPVTKEMETQDKTAIRHDRRTVIKKCIEMASTDVRVSRIFNKLASDSIVGGFSVNVESGETDAIKEKSQAIIDRLLEVCKVHRNLKGWIKNFLREADTFLQVYVDENSKEINRLKKLATIITFSNMNSQGNYPEGKPAYYQEHPLTRAEIYTFESWQICQISWQFEDGKPYGEALFGPARTAHSRLNSGEENMVVRRAVRAGIARQHKVGSQERPGGWEEVNKYKEENKDTLDNPTSAAQDFYTTGNIEIVELRGDTTVGQTDDIEYFEGLMTMQAGVPRALLSGGREESINRDVLKEQQEDYYKVVVDVNETIEHGLRQIFDFALLLQGINNESVKYTFNWGAKDRDDVDAKVARALQLQQLGFSFTTIFAMVDIDKLELVEELERIAAQVEEGIIPYGANMKLDPNILMLLGLQGGQSNKEVGEIAERLNKIQSIAEDQFGVMHPYGKQVETMLSVLKASKKGSK